MVRKSRIETKNALRQQLKKQMLNRADVDMSNINSSELREKAESITPEYIVSQMFNREIFTMKLDNACMYVMLSDGCQALLREFTEADYWRVE